MKRLIQKCQAAKIMVWNEWCGGIRLYLRMGDWLDNHLRRYQNTVRWILPKAEDLGLLCLTVSWLYHDAPSRHWGIKSCKFSFAQLPCGIEPTVSILHQDHLLLSEAVHHWHAWEVQYCWSVTYGHHHFCFLLLSFSLTHSLVPSLIT